MDTVEKKLKISILEKEVELSFPKVGHFMEIESRKQLLTGGQYASMANSYNSVSSYNLDLVDCISLLSVVVPDCKVKWPTSKASSWDVMEIEESREFVKVWRETIQPWYNEHLKILNDIDV